MPVITLRNPPSVHSTAGRYAHAVLVEGARRRLVVSGQVGLAPDGSLPEDGGAQMAQALANLQAVLEAHGMGIANVVKTTAFLTNRSVLDQWRAARAKAFGDHAPASTLLFIAGLADPRYVVEIEAEAVD